MSDRTNIWNQVEIICAELGYEPNVIAELHLTPTEATVTYFLLNEGGMKYTRGENYEVAKETKTHRITTVKA